MKVMLILALTLVASPAAAQNETSRAYQNGRNPGVDPNFNDPRNTGQWARGASYPGDQWMRTDPYQRTVAFGRCVVARDAATGLAFAQAADDSDASRAARHRAGSVIAACNRIAKPPPFGRSYRLSIQRAAIADALRERGSLDAVQPSG